MWLKQKPDTSQRSKQLQGPLNPLFTAAGTQLGTAHQPSRSHASRQASPSSDEGSGEEEQQECHTSYAPAQHAQLRNPAVLQDECRSRNSPSTGPTGGHGRPPPRPLLLPAADSIWDGADSTAAQAAQDTHSCNTPGAIITSPPQQQQQQQQLHQPRRQQHAKYNEQDTAIGAIQVAAEGKQQGGFMSRLFASFSRSPVAGTSGDASGTSAPCSPAAGPAGPHAASRASKTAPAAAAAAGPGSVGKLAGTPKGNGNGSRSSASVPGWTESGLEPDKAAAAGHSRVQPQHTATPAAAAQAAGAAARTPRRAAAAVGAAGGDDYDVLMGDMDACLGSLQAALQLARSDSGLKSDSLAASAAAVHRSSSCSGRRSSSLRGHSTPASASECAAGHGSASGIALGACRSSSGGGSSAAGDTRRGGSNSTAGLARSKSRLATTSAGVQQEPAWDEASEGGADEGGDLEDPSACFLPTTGSASRFNSNTGSLVLMKNSGSGSSGKSMVLSSAGSPTGEQPYRRSSSGGCSAGSNGSTSASKSSPVRSAGRHSPGPEALAAAGATAAATKPSVSGAGVSVGPPSLAVALQGAAQCTQPPRTAALGASSPSTPKQQPQAAMVQQRPNSLQQKQQAAAAIAAAAAARQLEEQQAAEKRQQAAQLQQEQLQRKQQKQELLQNSYGRSSSNNSSSGTGSKSFSRPSSGVATQLIAGGDTQSVSVAAAMGSMGSAAQPAPAGARGAAGRIISIRRSAELVPPGALAPPPAPRDAQSSPGGAVVQTIEAAAATALTKQATGKQLLAPHPPSAKKREQLVPSASGTAAAAAAAPALEMQMAAPSPRARTAATAAAVLRRQQG